MSKSRVDQMLDQIELERLESLEGVAEMASDITPDDAWYVGVLDRIGELDD